MTKEKFQELINEILSFGEQPEELSLWEDIYDDLLPEEKDMIVRNLQEELAALKGRKKA